MSGGLSGRFSLGIAGLRFSRGLTMYPQQLKQMPAINNTWTYFSEGDSSYNALQVDVNHRFANGFAVRGVYPGRRRSMTETR